MDFCTYNAVQLLIDLGATETESPDIDDKERTLDELITRLEQTLKILRLALPEDFTGKETTSIEVDLGAFSVTRDAMKYILEISVPSCEYCSSFEIFK